MNLDLSSNFEFGSEVGLRTFLLDHYFVHNQTAQALTKKFGGVFSTIGLHAAEAEEAWLELMRSREGPPPASMRDWLQLHALMHDQNYAALAGAGTVAPDLSVVDFSKPIQFYDWLYVHQVMHDFEQQSLGLT